MSNSSDIGGSRSKGHSQELGEKFSSQDVRKYLSSLRTAVKWNSSSEEVVTDGCIYNFRISLIRNTKSRNGRRDGE